MPPADATPSLDGLRRSLHALLGGLPLGGTLLGWTLVHVDVDEALAYVFERPGERLEIALGPRDDDAPRCGQTRSFNVSYFVARLKGRPLTDEAAPLVEAVVRCLDAHDNGRAAERLAPRSAVTDGPGEIRATRVETLLCPTTIDGVAYYTANPYVGCLIGCAFCYAQPRVAVIRRLVGLPERAWGRYVLVKENAAEVLDRELGARAPLPVVLSPLVADVYQPVERKLEVTRRCLEVLARRQVRAYVLTRSTLVLRDVELFQRIPGATVGFSVSTDRDDVGRAYEPRAAPISARLEGLRALREAGVRTVAVVQPIPPMDPERLAARLAEVCDSVRVDRYLPADLGGTPLRPATPGAPPPPTAEEERALEAQLVEGLRSRGVHLWTTHVPP